MDNCLVVEVLSSLDQGLGDEQLPPEQNDHETIPGTVACSSTNLTGSCI